MLLEQIKSANITALKEKDTVARSVFSILLGKIKLEEIRLRESGKEVDDTIIINLIQKSVKELAEQKENYQKVGNADMVAEIAMQQEILGKFLPKMLSKEEITQIISAMPDKSIGAVMKKFKAEYNGKCDMRLVNEIVKELQ